MVNPVSGRTAGLVSSIEQHSRRRQSEPFMDNIPGWNVGGACSARAPQILAQGALGDDFGGGSTTGLGKAIALERGLPIPAIPTTFVSSEMTRMLRMTEDSNAGHRFDFPRRCR